MVFRAKRTSENIAIALFSGVIIYFVHSAVSEFSFPSETVSALVSLVFSLFRLAVPAAIFIYAQKHAGFEKIKLEKAPDSSVKYNVMLAFVGFTVVFTFGILYSAAFPNAGVSYTYTDPLSASITVCSCAVVPAVFEEFLYRKLFCRELTVHGSAFAVISSSLLFALMHFSSYTFPYAFICGLVIGFVYIKTGSVRYTVAIHFANNFLSYLLSVIGAGMDHTAYFKMLMAIVIVLCALALAAIYFILPNNYEKFSSKEYANVSSSTFLTFPMVVLIICALILNFI